MKNAYVSIVDQDIDMVRKRPPKAKAYHGLNMEKGWSFRYMHVLSIYRDWTIDLLPLMSLKYDNLYPIIVRQRLLVI